MQKFDKMQTDFAKKKHLKPPNVVNYIFIFYKIYDELHFLSFLYYLTFSKTIIFNTTYLYSLFSSY